MLMSSLCKNCVLFAVICAISVPAANISLDSLFYIYIYSPYFQLPQFQLPLVALSDSFQNERGTSRRFSLAGRSESHLTPSAPPTQPAPPTPSSHMHPGLLGVWVRQGERIERGREKGMKRGEKGDTVNGEG